MAQELELQMMCMGDVINDFQTREMKNLIQDLHPITKPPDFTSFTHNYLCFQEHNKSEIHSIDRMNTNRGYLP